MTNKNPKYSKEVIERVLKNRIKEGKEEQKEFYESQKRQEKEVAKFYKNKKPLVFDSDSEEEEKPKTKKITKRALPEVHKDLDKYMKNFDLSIDKSLKPKKRLMRTMKIVEPKKTTMSTTKINKPVKKRNFMTTNKIVEYKPKEHELNKVISISYPN
jgi:hypothetical protein